MRPRKLLAAGVLAVVLGLEAPTVIAGNLEELRAMWRAARYEEAFDGLKDYRKEPYGKTFEVYYMAGTSLCHIAGNADLGLKYLQWILDNFYLDEDARQTVEAELSVCGDTGSNLPVAIAFNTTTVTAGVSGRTKMFYFVGGDNAFRSVPVEVVEEIPVESFLQRLFLPSDVEKAVENAAGLAGQGAKMQASEHFVLASLAGHSTTQLQNMGKTLDRVLDFFVSEYGMRPPRHLITAYLVSSTDKLQELARSLHGIKVARQSLGYSYRNDMSMVGFVPGGGAGTLLHELFHLMVRNDFGDVPPWMDEGMAALYEVAKITEDQGVQGMPNWRGKVLKTLSNLQPPVEKLVKLNWFQFSGEYDTAQQASNHAKARYFMLYLQENGRLTPVYKAFQAREVGTDPVKLLESALQEQDLDDVEKSFQEWFQGL